MNIFNKAKRLAKPKLIGEGEYYQYYSFDFENEKLGLKVDFSKGTQIRCTCKNCSIKMNTLCQYKARLISYLVEGK